MPNITDTPPPGLGPVALLTWVRGQLEDAYKVRDKLTEVIASLSSLEEELRHELSNAHHKD